MEGGWLVAEGGLFERNEVETGREEDEGLSGCEGGGELVGASEGVADIEEGEGHGAIPLGVGEGQPTHLREKGLVRGDEQVEGGRRSGASLELALADLLHLVHYI